MPATIPDLLIPSDQYVSLNTLSPIAVGDPMIAQLKSNSWVRVVESSTQPAPTVTDGLTLTSLNEHYAIFAVPLGSLEMWAICVPNHYSPDVIYSKINVQAL